MRSQYDDLTPASLKKPPQLSNKICPWGFPPPAKKTEYFNVADDPDSDPESDDEEFTRRRTTPKTPVIKELPTAIGLRMWLDSLRTEFCACSNRSTKRTLKYVQAAIGASSISAVEQVSKRWDSAVVHLAEKFSCTRKIVQDVALQHQGSRTYISSREGTRSTEGKRSRSI